MKILLAKRRALGDTILLSSTVELLKNVFPASEIDVLVPENFTSVLTGNPAIRNLFSFEAQGFFSLVARLRAEKYDYFLQLHSSPSGRALRWLVGARAALEHPQNADTEKAYGKHPNALEWDRFFLEKIFPAAHFPPAPMPKLFLTAAEKNWGAEWWRSRGADPAKVVFLGIGASRPTKRWPAAHFARLAELLRDRFALVPAIIHGQGQAEQEFAGEVIGHLRIKGFRPQNMPGEKGGLIFAAGLSVRELAAVLSPVLAYVGNDSGPKHLAVALGVPSFTFFGPEDPVEWHPYSREEHPLFFLSGLYCRKEDEGRWCGIPVCTVEQHRCMRDLDPLDVLAVFQQRLGLR